MVGLTDATGVQVNGYGYDPFGVAIPAQTYGMVPNPWRFQGGYLDSGTGLYKMGERYYDPAIGAWTQLDPAGSGGYTFVSGDPINLADPNGLCNLQTAGGNSSNLSPFANCKGTRDAIAGSNASNHPHWTFKQYMRGGRSVKAHLRHVKKGVVVLIQIGNEDQVLLGRTQGACLP